MKKIKNKSFTLLILLIIFISAICNNPMPIYADESTNTNPNTSEIIQTSTAKETTQITQPLNGTAQSTNIGTKNTTKGATQASALATTGNSSNIQTETSDNSQTVTGEVYSFNELPEVKAGEFIEWTPEAIFLFQTTGQVPVVQKVYEQQTVRGFLAATAEPNPEIDKGQMQIYLNNISGRRAINNSDRPDLADRNNESESIEATNGGALTLRRTDLALPGKDGLDLVLGRYYSSTQAALGTRKVCIDYKHDVQNQVAGTNGFKLYMVNNSGTRTYYGLYDSIDAANMVGENKYCNEPGQWAYYTTEQIEMNVGDYYNSLKFKSYSDTNNYLRKRYDLGAGWSFAFPSIERRDGDTLWDTATYLTFYDGKGSAYEINITSDTADSNLTGYQGKDRVVDLCSTLGKSYSNGVENAIYTYIEEGQKEYYFSWDGRLLGIKDHKGNEIKFTYTTRTIYNKQQQYIQLITDTVGRTVNFTYADNSDMSGSITVTVNDPSRVNNLSLHYIKDSFDYKYSEIYWDSSRDLITGDNPDFTRKEPRLARYINPEGKEIKYSYENKAVPFKFSSNTSSFMDVEPYTAQDTACMLSKIEYPHSCTYYSSVQSNKKLAQVWGNYTDWVISGRYDTELLNNAGSISEGPAKNQISYTKGGVNYTYKVYHNMPNLTYDFATTKNGVTTTQTYNMKGQETKAISTDGVKKIETTNESWDSRFNLKTTKTSIVESEVASGNSRAHMINSSYNDWGGLETYTDGITGAQQADRLQKYYYTDTANKYMLTKKEWNRNTGVPVSELYQYNNEGRLTKLTNAKNEETNYSYTTTSEGKVKDTTISLEDGKTARTSEIYGAQSNNAYPTETRLFYTGAPNGYTKTTTTYNMLLGLPATVTDDVGNQTVYSYDNLGRKTKIKLPDVNNYSVEQVLVYQTGVTSPLFDSVNQNLMTTMVNSYTSYRNKTTGQEQKYQEHKTYYNAYGQLILDSVYDEQKNIWIAVLQCHYDTYGHLIYEADALGNTNSYQYDGWDNLIRSTDPYSNNYKQEITYPNNGKMVLNYFLASGSSTPEHKFEAYYDPWDRIYQNKDQASGLTEQFDYDVVGNIIKHTDPRQNATNYNYDNLNQLTKVTDPLNQVTDYSYTRLGKIRSVNIAEGTTNFTTTRDYNEIGQQTKRTDPAGLFDTLGYNSLGLINSSADPNGTAFSYTYDAQNRITGQTGGGITYQYQYGNNPYGLESISLNNGSSVNYSYDGLGRLASKTITADGLSNTVSYQYDNAGKEIAIISPTGEQANYSYDKNRIKEVKFNSNYGKSTITYEYYPDGKLKTISFPVLRDGFILKNSYEYDGLNRLTSLTNAKGSTIISRYQYTYDNNGNIKTITDNYGTNTYNYDSLNRLIQIQEYNGKTKSYTYDVRGNRKTSEGDSIVTPGSEGFTYNAINQLTGVTNSGQTTSYTYDPTGLRIKKTTPNGTIRYSYDNIGRVISEIDANNQSSNYIWGPDRLLVKKDSSGKEYYFIYNGHGDVVQIVNEDGFIINSYEYDDWGNIFRQAETTDNDFKYSGEILDEETGFYYLRARYYDPTIGRFISKDSVEGNLTNPLSQNLYTYVENNPTKYVDPSGNALIFAGPSLITPEETIAHGETIAAVLLPDPNNAFDMTCLMMGSLGPEGLIAGEVGIVGRKAVTKAGEELIEHSGTIKRTLEGSGKAAEVLSKTKFKSQELFMQHYKKHVINQGEFGYISPQKYLERAQQLLSSKPSKDILSKTRTNGDRLFYNKTTNEFGVVDKDNNIKTFFKPSDGINYYNRQ